MIACSSARRSSRVVCEKVSKARRAAATALSTSSALPSAMRADRLLGGRVDHRRAVVGLGGLDPLAVDVELEALLHGVLLGQRAASNDFESAASPVGAGSRAEA